MRTNRSLSPISPDFYTLPEAVDVGGTVFPIRSDFETAFRFMDYVDKSKDDDETFLATVLKIWYPTVPEDTDKALTAAIRFYCGGNDPAEGYYTPAVNPDACREGIYLSFLKRYGIDLNRDKVHWWVFRSLLEGLKERRQWE